MLEVQGKDRIFRKGPSEVITSFRPCLHSKGEPYREKIELTRISLYNYWSFLHDSSLTGLRSVKRHSHSSDLGTTLIAKLCGFNVQGSTGVTSDLNLLLLRRRRNRCAGAG
jgi:hypothetical protein